MANNINQIISYIPDFRAVERGFNNLTKLNSILTKSLGSQLGEGFSIVDLKITKLKSGLNSLGQVADIGKFQATVKDTSGNLKTLVSTFETVPPSVNGVNSSINILNKTFSDGQKGINIFGINLTQLATRAAVTIPLWFALRAAIIGIPQAIAGSFKSLTEFDRLLQKTRFNISGLENLNEVMESIRDRITKLSLETGVSTEKITEAFERFASAGFDVETSFAGAEGAVKTSIALFGDAGQAADTFASAFKVLVDESEGAIAPQKQIQQIFAQTAELAKTNVFTFDQFRESLEKFAATSKIANFSQRETIALLATLNSAAIKGSRGGTLLRTAIQQLVGNLDAVSTELGIKVNPQLDSTFDVFIKVIDAVQELNKTTKITAQTTPILAEVFGGIRGTEIAQGLVATNKVLKDNLKVLGDFTKLDKDVDDINNSLSGQAKIFSNLTKEIGKAFVTGVIGGDDFVDTLSKINKFLEASVTGAELFGKAIKRSFQVGRGNFEGFFQDIAKDIDESASAAPIAFSNVQKQITTQFQKSLKDGLSKVETEDLLGQLIAFGADSLKLDPALFERMRSFLEDRLTKEFSGKPLQTNIQTDVSFDFQEDILKQQLASKRVNEDIIDDLTQQLELYSKQAEQITLTSEQQKEFNNLQKELLQNVSQQQADISKVLLDDAVDRFRAEGATASQILQATKAYRDQLSIDISLTDQINERLSLERAINEEKRLQNRLSSDSVKLFEIAQTSGVQIAKQIGDVLSGDTSFESFIRKGGTALEVFKTEFQDLFKSKQAEAFFKGDFLKGFQELRGGTGIDIAETGIRQQGIPRFDPNLALQQSKANAAQLQQLQNINVTAGLNINVTGLSFDAARDKIVDEVAKSIFNKIKQKGSPEREQLNTVLEEF